MSIYNVIRCVEETGEKIELLRRLADTRGLLILTDSDSAGFLIRNHIQSCIPKEKIRHAYIPDLYGCLLYTSAKTIQDASSALKLNNPAELPEACEHLLSEQTELRRELEKANARLANWQVDGLFDSAETVSYTHLRPSSSSCI